MPLNAGKPPIAAGTAIRFLQGGPIPPLLWNQYGEVYTSDGVSHYGVTVYAWRWRPLVSVPAAYFKILAPDVGARVTCASGLAYEKPTTRRGKRFRQEMDALWNESWRTFSSLRQILGRQDPDHEYFQSRTAYDLARRIGITFTGDETERAGSAWDQFVQEVIAIAAKQAEYIGE